jgi:hypothetical protein
MKMEDGADYWHSVPPLSHTDEPAVVVRDTGSSRIAYFPGDIERTYWLTGHGDLLRLMHNTLRWITRDERIVHVEGDGLIEMLAWETTPCYAIHLLNYTNPNAHHSWMQSTYPLGPQTVSMKLPSGAKVKSIELLRAEQSVSFHAQGEILRFSIPALKTTKSPPSPWRESNHSPTTAITVFP